MEVLMKNQIRFLLLVLVLAVSTVGALAQVPQFSFVDSSYLEQFRGKTFGEIVPKVWLDVCARNRVLYPDSNLVLPGNIVVLPLGEFYTAKPGGMDHMWQASVYFANEVAIPYLQKDTHAAKTVAPIVPAVPVKTETGDFPWGLAIFMIVLVAALMYLFYWLVFKRTVVPPPFIAEERIPDFQQATPEQLLPLAQEGLGRIYGEKNFEIVGPIEKGTIGDGTLTMFYADGSHRNETYHDEPGFRAHLRFKDGSESLIVSRWSCFNPCYTAQSAEFSGTFTPEGSDQPQMIERITEAEAGDIGENIRRIARGEEVVVGPSVAAPVQELPVAPKTKAPATAPADAEPEKEIKATKLQISCEKGITIEGETNLSFDQLKQLTELIVAKKS
ncbi:MAG: hypothetical protein V1696_00650 [Candidatus Jorgensenbacteria bacterium]